MPVLNVGLCLRLSPFPSYLMGSAYVNIYIPAFSFYSLETDLVRKFSIFTIRYDTRCYSNVRSKADISQLNLPHGNLARYILWPCVCPCLSQASVLLKRLNTGFYTLRNISAMATARVFNFFYKLGMFSISLLMTNCLPNGHGTELIA